MTQPAPTTSADSEIDGDALRAARQDKGHTQVELAALVGVAAPYLSQLETGTKKRMRPGTFSRLCDALTLTGDQRAALRKQSTAA